MLSSNQADRAVFQRGDNSDHILQLPSRGPHSAGVAEDFSTEANRLWTAPSPRCTLRPQLDQSCKTSTAGCFREGEKISLLLVNDAIDSAMRAFGSKHGAVHRSLQRGHNSSHVPRSLRRKHSRSDGALAHFPTGFHGRQQRCGCPDKRVAPTVSTAVRHQRSGGRGDRTPPLGEDLETPQRARNRHDSLAPPYVPVHATLWNERQGQDRASIHTQMLQASQNVALRTFSTGCMNVREASTGL